MNIRIRMPASPAPLIVNDMKRCPFCAEDIQAAAIVCRFCTRDLPPRAAARPSLRRELWIIGAVTIAIGAITAVIVGSDTRAPYVPPPPILDVQGIRRLSVFALTNHEPIAVTACTVTVLDSGSGHWTVDVPSRIEPSATVNIPWGAFTNRGQPMPPQIGLTREFFTVDCKLANGGARQGAGLRFRQ